MKILLIVGLGLLLTLETARADGKQSAPGYSQPATDVSGAGVGLDNSDDIRNGPITVETWVRLHDASNFNIIMASDTKASSRHWELYTFPTSGALAFYTASMGTSAPCSDTSICDDVWHYVAATFEKGKVTLYVDGRLVERIGLPVSTDPPTDGQLAIGQLVEGGAGVGIGCNGLIQDVKVSKGVHEIKFVPTAPFKKDASTLLTWPQAATP